MGRHGVRAAISAARPRAVGVRDRVTVSATVGGGVELGGEGAEQGKQVSGTLHLLRQAAQLLLAVVPRSPPGLAWRVVSPA
jgi:hypothetical protein